MNKLLRSLTTLVVVLVVAFFGYWGWKTDWNFGTMNKVAVVEDVTGEASVIRGMTEEEYKKCLTNGPGKYFCGDNITGSSLTRDQADRSYYQCVRWEGYNSCHDYGVINTGDIENAILINKYYSAIFTGDFTGAAAYTIDETDAASKLAKSYTDVLEIRPNKIESIGSGIYQFYVILRYKKTPSDFSVYSVKKQVIDGKIKSISSKSISNANLENEHFYYYQDEFLSVKRESFNVKDTLKEFYPNGTDCNDQPGYNKQRSLEAILAKFADGDLGYKYTFYIKDTNFFREFSMNREYDTGSIGVSTFVIPNKMGYNNITFMNDFGQCGSVGAKGLLVGDNFISFITGCGSGGSEPQYCDAISSIIQKTLKLK